MEIHHSLPIKKKKQENEKSEIDRKAQKTQIFFSIGILFYSLTYMHTDKLLGINLPS